MRTIVTLAIALLSFIACAANTITVTTNADSGPGSLRDAITLANANGTAVPDTILFNIADVTEAGRTIHLQSELPALTSNITIDGSSQPGAVLGISTAKITLYLDHVPPKQFLFLSIIDAQNVNIYGLCFLYFDEVGSNGSDNYGIYLRRSHQITIGAPGKGNLFSRIRRAITNVVTWETNIDSVTFVTIQSNVFGLNSANNLARNGMMILDRASEITFGGPTPAEGNVVIATTVVINESANPNSTFFAKIQHNKVNTDWTGTNYYIWELGAFALTGNRGSVTNVTRTFILDNIMATEGISLTVSQVTHRVVVRGNKFGTDITGTICKSFGRMNFSSTVNVVVGGYTPAEENIITGDISYNSPGVNIIRNKLGWIFDNWFWPGNHPFIKIVTYGNGLITGKSNPNAKVQLYTNTCNTQCINRNYLATVYADAAGNWSFPYTAAMPNIIATATWLEGQAPDSTTSSFSEPKVNHLNVKYKDATCGRSNGSITGIVITEGTHIEWRDASTNLVVGTDTNLVNVPAGTYVLYVSNGANGCPWNAGFVLRDHNVPPTVSANITHASCGQNSGAITASVPGNVAVKWLNANNDSIGNNSFINNLAPGTYYLKAWINFDTSCNKTYGPYVVQNLSGPSLNINSVAITAATCGNSNGSITGITVNNITGTPYIRWVDSLNNFAGNSYDLLNVPAGKYKLKVKDASSCDTMITQFFIVPGNGIITIDTTGKRITASKCSGNTGSIQQIKVTGGDTYQWINTANNTVVGTAVNVSNLPSGSYQLVVNNAYGCTKNSPVIVVPQSTFIPIGVTSTSARAPFCGKNNGHTRINSFNNDSTKYTFRWIDSAKAQQIATGTAIYNLDAGTYQLFATDSNGCEKKIFTSILGRSPAPVIDYSKLVVKDDQCNAGLGSIAGLQITGIYGPTTYSWVNQNSVVAGTSLNLQNAAAGTYVLQVVDANVCSFESNPIVIKNSDVLPQNPVYDDLSIPRNTAAVLNVKNPASGNYRLYADAAGTQLIQQNGSGNFTINNINADTSFYIQRISGTCSTGMVRVNVKVVDKSFFAIPNAFTPNGDRLNERLPVKVIGHVELTYFRIFNRWGQLIFETRQLNNGWDGLFKGLPQPSGVYVWVAEGKDLTGKIVRSKGSFVLIR